MAKKRRFEEKEIIHSRHKNCEMKNDIIGHDDDESENFALDSASESEKSYVEYESDSEVHDDATKSEIELLEDIAVYASADGTQWNSCPISNSLGKRCIKGTKDKVVLPPGKVIEKPVDCFRLFVAQEIVDMIVKFTNVEAERTHGMDWKNTDRLEIQAFIGLLLSAGTNKQSKVNILDFWDPLFGNPIFRATMSKNRFKILQKFIRFDDKASRSERRNKDKFAPIREVWDLFNINLRKTYIPSENLTIDEQLIPFSGRVSFKIYMPSKPDKYGMKLWWICDNATSYPLHGIPYLGREGHSRIYNLSKNIVEKLCEPYFGTNRNVTFDNFFTSKPLAESLLINGMTVVGTLRKNKPYIPKNFLPNKDRPLESNFFGFRKNMTLVSYVPKKNRAVILLSTKHSDNNIMTTNKNKSEINIFYNQTKGGVDTLDQMAHTYTVRRKTNRWPMAYFHNLIDVGGIAAQVVWKKTNVSSSHNMTRKEFLRSIILDMVTPHMNKRNLNGIDDERQEEIKKLVLVHEEYDYHNNTSIIVTPTKKRCSYCPSKIGRMSKQACEICLKSVCSEHSKKKIVCNKCL